MSAEVKKEIQLEIGRVMFIDIVGSMVAGFAEAFAQLDFQGDRPHVIYPLATQLPATLDA